MIKVEIITRAINRLEYTVKCITSIDKNAGYDNFKHIIINQNSTDGTTQWLKSLLKEGYYKLKVKHNEKNTGDAGGMKNGWDMLDDDTKYVMQWDNDCEALSPDFLKELVSLMENDEKIGCIMLKRENVHTIIQPKNIKNIQGHKLGQVPIATCCMILRRSLVEEINEWRNGETIGWGHSITKKMQQKGYKVLKCLDIRVDHIDGAGGQKKKYPSYYNNIVKRGTNFTKVNYDN